MNKFIKKYKEYLVLTIIVFVVFILSLVLFKDLAIYDSAFWFALIFLLLSFFVKGKVVLTEHGIGHKTFGRVFSGERKLMSQSDVDLDIDDDEEKSILYKVFFIYGIIFIIISLATMYLFY